MEVIVPCAGLGTRLLPGSKSIPKEMFPIVNKPAIDYIAEEIRGAGLNDIILITGKNKDSIVDYFDSSSGLERDLEAKGKIDLLNSIVKFNNLNIVTIRQKKMLGLGHAVYIGKKIIKNRPFCVVLPDMIIENGSKYLARMVSLYRKFDEGTTSKGITSKGIIALMRVNNDVVLSYGVVDIKNLDGDICDISNLVEKPSSIDEAPSNLAVVGRYILPNDVFDVLKNTQPGKNGEIQLTDALKLLAKEGRLMGIIIDDFVHDIGTPIGFVKANIFFSLKAHGHEIKEYLQDINYLLV